jgi:hypothetical protein
VGQVNGGRITGQYKRLNAQEFKITSLDKKAAEYDGYAT